MMPMIDESVKNEIVDEISQKLNLKFSALEREIREITASQTAELKAEMEKQKKEMIAVLTETIKSLQETQEYHLKVSIATLKEQRELSEELKESLEELAELARKSGRNVVKIAEIGEKEGDVRIVIEAQKMLEEQKELLEKIYKEVMDNKEGLKAINSNAIETIKGIDNVIDHQNQWFPHIVKELKEKMSDYYGYTEKYLSDIDGNMKVTKDMVKSMYQARY